MHGLAPIGDAAVHLCIDMQKLFLVGSPWAVPWLERRLPQVMKLVEHAPERTVFTRFITPSSAEDAGGMWRRYYRKWESLTRDRIDTALLDLVPALQRHAPPAIVIDKFVYSAFADGSLHRLLRRRRVDTIVISGSEIDVCVLSSVYAAMDLGYRIVIAKDAVISSSDTSHDTLMSLFDRRFDVQIEMATVDEIVECWARG